MNVLIINHYASTPENSVGTRHYDLAKELINLGHCVTIFGSAFMHHGGYAAQLEKRETFRRQEYEGIKYIWIKTFPYERNNWRRYWGMIIFMIRSIQIGRKRKNLFGTGSKPDLIVGSSVHLLAVFAAFILARKHRAHFVMEVRDLWPQTLVDMGVLGDKSPVTILLRIIERFLYKKAEKIVTLLPYSYEYIVKHGGNRDKIVWIPNGVKLAPEEKDMQSSLENGFDVIYLGAHGIANKLDVILEAARIVQERGHEKIRFRFIGKGPEKDNLIGKSRLFNLKYVDFMDPIKKKNVPKFLRNAGVLIISMGKTDIYKYGISLNKLYDYMAARRPIIFSTNSRNNPVLDSGCGISIPPEDPELMAQAIIDIYRMTEAERTEMGIRGRHYVELHHDWAKLGAIFEKILVEISKNRTTDAY